jgi:hypothetical protein
VSVFIFSGNKQNAANTNSGECYESCHQIAMPSFHEKIVTRSQRELLVE